MNMTDKAKATVAGIKDLGGEVSAWEGRLVHMQSTVDSLKLQKEAMEKEILEKKQMHNLHIERSQAEISKERAKLSEEKDALAAKQQEVTQAFADLRKEKTAFEKERDTIMDLKKDAEMQREKAINFLRVVREHSALL